jgi:hypothetical protein
MPWSYGRKQQLKGRGEENAGSSSDWTLAAAAPAVGASKKLKAFPHNFVMHSSEPTFGIIYQALEQAIRHVQPPDIRRIGEHQQLESN